MLGKWEHCKTCDGSGRIQDDVNESHFYGCADCDGAGNLNVPVDEEQIVFVNVYSITRHYGGPEEGGWWYNWDACIESIPVQNKYSDVMAEEMEKRYLPRKHGNIYSVLGGTDYEIRIEAEPKESETKERPHYE